MNSVFHRYTDSPAKSLHSRAFISATSSREFPPEFLKENKSFVYILIIFFIISINSIYSFTVFLSSDKYSLAIRQALFYLIGIIFIFFILKTDPKKILKYASIIYIINVLSLILVLLFGTEINGTRAWFNLPIFGTIQPSGFMKIGLILYLAKIIDKQKLKNAKDELILILKCFIVVLIPSVITFLEPDTGAVLVYLIITIAMLFTSKLRIRWFVFLFLMLLSLISSVFLLYLFNGDLFIKIFGSSMFYRLDRIFDWQKSSGMQLENSLITIGSSGILGKGISNILLYFPVFLI